MSKPCSPKSKFVNNAQYECNPKTGKYSKKAEFKAAQVGCSPKSKFINDPRYECGPNGRYLLKKGYKSKPLPGAPKAPLNGYMLWMIENRPNIKAALMAQGNMGPKGNGPSVTDVAKAGGAQWKALGAAGQAPWNNKFKAVQATYKPMLDAFKAQNNGKSKGISEKAKKSASAYNLWFKQVGFPGYKSTLNGGKANVAEAAKILGSMWTKLSESEKAPFKQMAQELKAKQA